MTASPVPISLIIDDPGPLINVYWWHAAAAQKTDHPILASGEQVAQRIPLDFLHSFVELISTWEVRGKFSVLPYPAGLGPVSRGWPGCDLQALNQWLEIIRREVTPRMDITPEILTHARTLDLKTGGLLEENERDWAEHQDEIALTAYISHALELLNEVGLEATGVTSPWNFGIEVEDAYRAAIRRALKQVNNRSHTWYFLHEETRGTEFLSRVVDRDEEGWLVSICSQATDNFWQTMDTLEETDDYIASIADTYLTEDGKSGRLTALFDAGTPMVLCTHWQSLFSNGRATGLRALRQLCRRIDSQWGMRIKWTKCSELAEMVATI